MKKSNLEVSMFQDISIKLELEGLLRYIEHNKINKYEDIINLLNSQIACLDKYIKIQQRRIDKAKQNNKFKIGQKVRVVDYISDIMFHISDENPNNIYLDMSNQASKEFTIQKRKRYKNHYLYILKEYQYNNEIVYWSDSYLEEVI